MKKDVFNLIEKLNKKIPVRESLNGGCYIFAKSLKQLLGSGEIFYLLDECHMILFYDCKFYDASGNVTNKYTLSRKITEKEFLSRPKLRETIKG